MDDHPPRADDRQQQKRAAALLAAVRAAFVEPGEHRLFKSGKLDGLFPSKTGPVGEAATEAVRGGLLESTRTEVKGKVAIEWVRLTPRGVDFLYEHDSPRSVLTELRHLLHDTKAGIPGWLDGLRDELAQLATRFGEEMQRYLQRLDALTQRVEEALRRVDALGPTLPDQMQMLVPWGLDALTYLDRRKADGAAHHCSLPELFEALHERHPDLTIRPFHDGLRRLADNRAVRLIAFSGPTDQLPRPEYALLDGAKVLYHVCR